MYLIIIFYEINHYLYIYVLSIWDTILEIKYNNVFLQNQKIQNFELCDIRNVIFIQDEYVRYIISTKIVLCVIKVDI